MDFGEVFLVTAKNSGDLLNIIGDQVVLNCVYINESRLNWNKKITNELYLYEVGDNEFGSGRSPLETKYMYLTKI